MLQKQRAKLVSGWWVSVPGQAALCREEKALKPDLKAHSNAMGRVETLQKC